MRAIVVSIWNDFTSLPELNCSTFSTSFPLETLSFFGVAEALKNTAQKDSE